MLFAFDCGFWLKVEVGWEWCVGEKIPVHAALNRLLCVAAPGVFLIFYAALELWYSR